MTLTEAREKARYTKRKIANEIGVTPLTITKWERGITLPNVKQYGELCKRYGCKWDEIFFGS